MAGRILLGPGSSKREESGGTPPPKNEPPADVPSDVKPPDINVKVKQRRPFSFRLPRFSNPWKSRAQAEYARQEGGGKGLFWYQEQKAKQIRHSAAYWGSIAVVAALVISIFGNSQVFAATKIFVQEKWITVADTFEPVIKFFSPSTIRRQILGFETFDNPDYIPSQIRGVEITNFHANSNIFENLPIILTADTFFPALPDEYTVEMGCYIDPTPDTVQQTENKVLEQVRDNPLARRVFGKASLAGGLPLEPSQRVIRPNQNISATTRCMVTPGPGQLPVILGDNTVYIATLTWNIPSVTTETIVQVYLLDMAALSRYHAGEEEHPLEAVKLQGRYLDSQYRPLDYCVRDCGLTDVAISISYEMPIVQGSQFHVELILVDAQNLRGGTSLLHKLQLQIPEGIELGGNKCYGMEGVYDQNSRTLVWGADHPIIQSINSELEKGIEFDDLDLAFTCQFTATSSPELYTDKPRPVTFVGRAQYDYGGRSQRLPITVQKDKVGITEALRTRT